MTLWGAGFLLALGVCWVWMGTGSVHNDFTQNVWLPARLVLNGANPYYPDPVHLQAALGAYSPQFLGFNSGPEYHFIYPLWLAMVFVPLALLPLEPALLLWRAANLVLLCWSVAGLLRSSHAVFRSGGAAARAVLLITVVLSILYRESIVTLAIGQFSIIELALLVWIGQYLITAGRGQAERHRRGGGGDLLLGVTLGVLLTKPQALVLPVLLLGLWALARRRWAVPAGALGTAGLLLLVPAIFAPWALQDWLGIVLGGQAQSQATVSASVWGLAYQLLGPAGPWIPLAGGLTGIGLLLVVPWWWRDLRDRNAPLPSALPFTLCLNSVLSPYLLGYEHVLLLLPAIGILGATGLPTPAPPAPDERALWHRQRRWRILIHAWLVLLPLLVVLIQLPTRMEYPAILQSATMLGMCWWVRGHEVARDMPATQPV